MGDPYNEVHALHVRASGEVVCSTYSTNPVRTFDDAAGTWTWIPGTTDGYVWTFVDHAGIGLCVGGNFAEFDGELTFNLAEWDGANWSATAPGEPANSPIGHLQRMPNGDVIALGHFTEIGGARADGIARWDGSRWTALGSPPPLILMFSFGMAALANGDLVISSFTVVGTVLYRWDGISWTTLALIPAPPHRAARAAEWRPARRRHPRRVGALGRQRVAALRQRRRHGRQPLASAQWRRRRRRRV
ncbi:MAG: hypothetical protein KDC98_14930, partial [Planctomycetes bacterium]|nr:hypothetical protein [Planctomycetota bacterium]